MTDIIQSAPVFRYDVPHPEAFTQARVGWVPWLEPKPVDELTDREYTAAIDANRLKSDYFRLLVRDPEILAARTRTDNDIFYNVAEGLPRAERELAAATASRVNGCVFCASVHARFSSHYSKREADVQRLLDEGVTAQLGERWDAIVDAAAAVTRTPFALTTAHVARLRAAGLDDLSIADVIHGAAFFNWANRLMLSLGRATAPID